MLTRTSFHNYCKTAGWHRTDLKLLVACSGGVDSTVLLHLLLNEPGLTIQIVHFDHQLRGSESLADSRFVQELGQKIDCKVHVISENISAYAEQNDLSIEEAGSLRRRLQFERLRVSLGYDLIATGQHQDDQIETILMNLYHGAGIQGLAGTAEQINGFIRPLSNFSRRNILEYAEQHKLGYREDTTNRDISFLRNNLRANLIPILQADKIRDLRACINAIYDRGSLLNEMIAASVESVDIKGFREDYAPKIALGMRDLPDYFSPIQKAIFDRAFQSISLKTQGLSSIHFSALKSLLVNEAIGKEMQLPGSVTGVRDRENLIFYQKSAFQWDACRMTSTSNHTFPFFHFEYAASALGDNIMNPNCFWYVHNPDAYKLRRTEPGDKMIVDETGRSVSISQILQAARIAPHAKAFFPVMEYNGEILWIPGVRTAFAGKLEMHSQDIDEIRHCIKVQFQKGTFE